MENLNGYTTETIQRGAYLIRIHRPELSETEREKREHQIRDTLENALKSYIGRKEKKR